MGNSIPKPQGILKPVQPPQNRNTNFDQHISAADLAGLGPGGANPFFPEGSPMKNSVKSGNQNYLSPP